MKAMLIRSFDIAKSTQTNISTLLRFADPLALFQIIRQCFAPQFVYLARHVFPSIFAETAGCIDVYLVKMLQEALGQISGSSQGADPPSNAGRWNWDAVDAEVPRGCIRCCIPSGGTDDGRHDGAGRWG
jgi:hypothetical protein